MDFTNIDINKIKNLDDFSGIVPLFPLSSVVFFPNTLLPLHIFEPRYQQMLNDTLNSEKIIGMVLLKPGWEKNYYGNPEIFGVAGIGRIVSTEKMDNGRSNVVLYGLKRVKIIEEIGEKPYRLARIEILESDTSDKNALYKEKLCNLISTWNEMLSSNQKKHKIKVNTNLPLNSLTDVLSSVLMTNIYDKQEMLEETSVSKRAEKLIDFVETRLRVFSITSRIKDSILSTRKLN